MSVLRGTIKWWIVRIQKLNVNRQIRKRLMKIMVIKNWDTLARSLASSASHTAFLYCVYLTHRQRDRCTEIQTHIYTVTPLLLTVVVVMTTAVITSYIHFDYICHFWLTSQQLPVPYVRAMHWQKAPGGCNIQVQFVTRSRFAFMNNHNKTVASHHHSKPNLIKPHVPDRVICPTTYWVLPKME